MVVANCSTQDHTMKNDFSKTDSNSSFSFLQTKRSARAGAMLPLIAVTMVILFVAAVLAIDIARIHVTKAELRTATDAAARVVQPQLMLLWQSHSRMRSLVMGLS
jgi:hypothetical protein